VLLQATCLQDMKDKLVKASDIVQNMREAFNNLKTDHE
jgi:hypothetical protein